MMNSMLFFIAMMSLGHLPQELLGPEAGLSRMTLARSRSTSIRASSLNPASTAPRPAATLR